MANIMVKPLLVLPFLPLTKEEDCKCMESSKLLFGLEMANHDIKNQEHSIKGDSFNNKKQYNTNQKY